MTQVTESTITAHAGSGEEYKVIKTADNTYIPLRGLADSDGNHVGTLANPLPMIPMPIDFGDADNLLAAENSAVTFTNTYGMSTIGFHLTIPSGSVKSEISFDGINWEGASMRHMEDDELESTLIHTGHFLGSISGARFWRLRVTAAMSGTGTVIGRADNEVSVIETVEFNAPPHRVGYAVQHKDFQFTDTQTNEVLWTPAAGRRIVVTMIMVAASGSTDGRVTIFEDTNVQGKRFFNNAIEVATNKNYSQVIPFDPACQLDAVDTSLKLTTTAAIDVDILIVGYEV